MAAEATDEAGGGEGEAVGAGLVEAVEAVAAEGAVVGVLVEVGGDGGFFEGDGEAEVVGDDAVEGAGFDDVGAGGEVEFAAGGGKGGAGEGHGGEIVDEDGVLEEMAVAEEAERLAAAEAREEFGVAAVEGQAAQE